MKTIMILAALFASTANAQSSAGQVSKDAPLLIQCKNVNGEPFTLWAASIKVIKGDVYKVVQISETLEKLEIVHAKRNTCKILPNYLPESAE
jgi:hypothetical protein